MGQNAISRTRAVHIDSNKQTNRCGWELDPCVTWLCRGALAAITLSLVSSPDLTRPGLGSSSAVNYQYMLKIPV